MSGEQNIDRSSGAEGAMGPGVLLRAAADGELDPCQRERLAAHLREHPEDLRRVDFERQLRDACGRSLGGPSAPAHLREAIVAARGRDGVLARLRPALQTLAAAVLLLVAVAFLARMAAIGGGAPALAGYAELAGYVAAEHEACERDPSRAAKFTVERLDAVPQRFQNVLGGAAGLSEFQEAGLTFRDAGECRLPGRGPSVHVRFERVENGEAVSLFIQRARDSRVDFEPGRAYRLRSPGNDALGREVYAWRSGELNYYIVADGPGVWDCLRGCRNVPSALREGR